MSDIINESILVNLPENTGEKIKVEIVSRKRFNHGGGKDKFKVDAKIISGEASFPVKLVQRDFGIDRMEPELIANNVYSIWEYCHKNNGPVVPVLARAEDGTFLMPDLEADGSRIYGRSINQHMNGGQNELRRYEKEDDTFLTLMDEETNIQAIRRKATEATNWFNDHSILLPKDDALDLVVHTDGSFEVIALDIEQISRVKPTDFNETMKAGNSNCVNRLIFELELAKSRLEKFKLIPSAKTIRQS